MTNLYDETTILTLPHAEGGQDEITAYVRKSNHPHRPKCLFIHGNPGCLLDWAHLIPRLSNVADVAAIDLPGFGRSARRNATPEAVDLEHLATSVVGAADALGWHEPIFLVGHSHGGGVAQMVAARHPARVAGLVLIASLGATMHPSYRALSLPGMAPLMRGAGLLFGVRLLRPMSRLILGQIMRDIFAPEGVPAATLERELDTFASRPEILVTMVHVALGDPCAQLRAAAPSIRCPTLFIHGSKDKLVPSAYAQALRERILEAGGSCRFELVGAAGHMLIIRQAEHVGNRIRAHLEINWKTPKSATSAPAS